MWSFQTSEHCLTYFTDSDIRALHEVDGIILKLGFLIGLKYT